MSRSRPAKSSPEVPATWIDLLGDGLQDFAWWEEEGIRLSHNSAFDIRRSEQTIRQKLIEAKAVDVMVAKGQLRWILNPGRYVGVAAGGT